MKHSSIETDIRNDNRTEKANTYIINNDKRYDLPTYQHRLRTSNVIKNEQHTLFY